MEEEVKYGFAIESNKKTLQYINDVTSLIFGTSAGILQLESTNGFIFFLGTNLLVSTLFILSYCLGKPGDYYVTPIKSIYLDNFARSLTAYLTAWTLAYALVQS
ncbi:CYFA0S01e02938g1_1 [Cyberlindnera fabianii]|uniref:ER membrane protein complex subunit 6 n=1 Tax=Cyberlindnera fabianii TaxID=36022 RepID=A0A061AMN5_CYBFA|nr:CYFA0S01e02938g1_1 [Cyberlindnera fabianii]